MAGRTRIHLDRVERLGSFVELEVVLAEGESPEAGQREAQALLTSLAIAESDLVPTHTSISSSTSTLSNRIKHVV